MKKYIKILALVLALTICSAKYCYAQNVSGASANLSKNVEDPGFDYRVENLRNFLQKYNSPLAEYAEDFVKYADENNLDYRLVPAISGVESTFGKFIPENSYNAYGWANGDYSFSSWEDSISHVSFVLKSSYIDKGIASVNQISKIYAPPSKTWGSNVNYFISKIDTLPVNFDII